MRVEMLSLSDAIELSDWKYDYEYSVYNFPNWSEMEKENWAITVIDKREKQFRKVIDTNMNFIGWFRFQEFNDNILISLGMNPIYCGKHLGNKFIKTIINYLNDAHNKLITLEVRSFNERAIKCYLKSGFKISNKISKIVENTKVDFIIMEYK